MLRAKTPSDPSAGRDTTTDRSVTPSDILSVLDDEYTRDILATIEAEPKPARRIFETCDASRTTVYRRLNSLEEIGLVDSGLQLDTGGHHKTVYEATLDNITVELGANGLSVSITTSKSQVSTTEADQFQSSD